MSVEIEFVPISPEERTLRNHMELEFGVIEREKREHVDNNEAVLIESAVLFPEIYDFYGTKSVIKYYDKKMVYDNIEYIDKLYKV